MGLVDEKEWCKTNDSVIYNKKYIKTHTKQHTK